jgi:DNA-binding protein H-NS
LGLQHQGQAFHQGLEKDLAVKVERIWALKKELESSKKLVEENGAARKTVEEQIEKLGQVFEGYQKKKLDEHNKFVASAQRAANAYKDLIKTWARNRKLPAMILLLISWIG